MKDIERVIEQVNASMSMEGMPLTNDDKDRIRRYAGDNNIVNEAIAELIRKHSVAQDSEHKPSL